MWFFPVADNDKHPRSDIWGDLWNYQKWYLILWQKEKKRKESKNEFQLHAEKASALQTRYVYAHHLADTVRKKRHDPVTANRPQRAVLGTSKSRAALQGRMSKATTARVQPCSTQAGLGQWQEQWQSQVGEEDKSEPGPIQEERGLQRELPTAHVQGRT